MTNHLTYAIDSVAGRAYETHWHCPPPPVGSRFKVVRDEWDFLEHITERHIYEISLGDAEVCLEAAGREQVPVDHSATATISRHLDEILHGGVCQSCGEGYRHE